VNREWKDEPFWGSLAPGPLQQKGGQKLSEEESVTKKEIFPCLQGHTYPDCCSDISALLLKLKTEPSDVG